MHDFADRALGEFAKAVPYGVYDVADNAGWVSVGDSADTAEFAVESIRRWWNTLGRDRFPTATRLLITADAGGSNGYRPRAQKWFLARLAADTGLEITVLHYPPGTSKWNKIEHRLFSYITMNRRGRPLTDIATIVELIASTTTQTGLTVQAAYDPALVPTRHQDHQHTNGTTAPAPPPLARRMELHHHTQLNTRPNSRRTLSTAADSRLVVGGMSTAPPSGARFGRCWRRSQL